MRHTARYETIEPKAAGLAVAAPLCNKLSKAGPERKIFTAPDLGCAESPCAPGDAGTIPCGRRPTANALQGPRVERLCRADQGVRRLA
jgi:hypothetical protein